MTAVATWTCPSCAHAVSTPYCPTCGERPHSARDLTLRGLLDQAFEAMTNIDGRMLRSLRWLVTRPGHLTVAYVEGRRKPFLAPIQLFLVANVLFFAVESMTGGTVFSTPLQSHLHTQPWSDAMRPLIARRLASLDTTAAAYAPQFDAAVALHARSLILLMAVWFTALPALVFRRSRQPFAAHAVFSLHLYAFTLVLLSAGTIVPAVPQLWGATRSESDWLDHALSISLVAACAVYLYVAVGAVYGERGVSRMLKCAALTIGATAIFLGYRFVLLLITLYST
jgi:uncharacterized protein DUF3667